MFEYNFIFTYFILSCIIMTRPDLIFSYWILAWYFLYIFGISRVYNPKFALIIGFIENLIIFILMVYYKTKPKIIILFTIIVFLMKIIPLYTIWNTKVTNKDIIATIILFFIYLFWSFIVNGIKMSYFINIQKDLILYNKIKTPGIKFLDKILTFITKKL